MKGLFTILSSVLWVAIMTLPDGMLAQAPQKISYQGVIRDGEGLLVTNSEVGIQIQILQGSEIGAPVFEETHTVTTNVNGLASLEIGGGTSVAGSLETIDWASGPYFIKTETDPEGGTNYTISGTSELLSVPYAFYANVAGSGGGTPPVVTVGQLLQGGVVIYVTPDGKHGLVAATQDQSETSNWFTTQNNISNPVNHNEAGKAFTDWRLPTRYELDLMYQVLKDNTTADFADDFYWSSTEDDFQNVWRQDFTDGRQALINKGAPSRVRAIRSF